MGMPLSAVTYDVLRALARAPSEHSYSPDADAQLRSTLAGFPAAALVLYDPAAHPDFARHLAEAFRHLDELTADNVVFFALVDDPTIEEHAVFRRRHDALRGWLDDAHASVRPRGGSGDPDTLRRLSDATIAMALAADIPYDALPCVLFTVDIDADAWGWVSVDADTLVPAFDLLVQLAEASLPGLLVDPQRLAECVALSLGASRAAFQPPRLRLRWTREVREALPAPPYGETHARRRLASALADVVACHGKLLGHQRIAAGALFGRTTDADPHDDDLRLFGMLRMARMRTQPKDDDARADQLVSLPALPDASAALRTGIHLLGAMPRHLDMSAAALCLGKGVEILVNATAIQLLRREHGIDIPPHYRAYDRARGALALPVRRWGPAAEVDINARERNLPWRPLTLGPAVAVLAEHGIDALTSAAARELVDLARTMAPTRNAAAHWKVMAETEVTEVASAVLRAAEGGLFRELERIVESLVNGRRRR